MGAVDYEKGYKWSLTLMNNTAERKTFLYLGTLDIGAPALFHHSSIWLRTAAGYSPGSRHEPFANFYFGGFGNNWVDHRHPKRYREFYSFPGLS